MKPVNKVYSDMEQIQWVEKVRIEVKGIGTLEDFTDAIKKVLPDGWNYLHTTTTWVLVEDQNEIQQKLLLSTRLFRKTKSWMGSDVSSLLGNYTLYLPFPLNTKNPQ